MKCNKLIFSLFFFGMFSIPLFSQTDSIIQAKIIDDGSQEAEKFYNSGVSNFELKKYSEAIQDFDQAIKLKHGFEKAFYNRGLIYLEIKRYKEALADFDSLFTLKN